MIKVFHHIFFLKKTKHDVKEPVPIYLRITISGKRAEISINRKIEPNKWISNAGRMKGNNQVIKRFNAYLISLESKLYEAYYSLIRENEVITAETLKNKYTGASDMQRMLIPIFQKHNKEFSALVPKEYSAATLERYKTSLAHTIKFLQWKYKVSDFDIRSINHEFITEYDFFLRTVRKCAYNTTVKYIKNFKRIIRICITNGWLDKDPFAKYKARIKIVEKVFLCEEELLTILKKIYY